MGRKLTGKQSETLVERIQKNGSIYVYVRTTWYDPEIRNTRSKMKLQGIRDPSTGEIIPTRPKNKQSSLAPAVTAVPVTVKMNAMVCIIKYYSERSGVTKEVLESLPEDQGHAQKILTLAWFAFATQGKTWTAANTWTARYLNLMPYSYGSITKDIYQELFHFIGRNPGIEESIFVARAKQFGQGELVAWDSTTYVCGVESVHDAVKSVHKDSLIKDVYKVFFFYSVTSRQLIGYVKLHGSTPDSITVPYALAAVKTWGLKKPMILQDNGYTNSLTIGELLHQGLHFVTRVLPTLKWVQPIIDKYRYALINNEEPSQIVYCEPEFSGVSHKEKLTFTYVRKYASKSKGIAAGEHDKVESNINIFVYYSSSKKGHEDKEFRQTICRVRDSALAGRAMDEEDKMFMKNFLCPVIEDGNIVDYTVNLQKKAEKMKNHGFLVLISDYVKDVTKALATFRIRERIEESIKGHKSYTGGDSSKTGSDMFLSGELLIEFLGNSMRESMLSNFRNFNRTLGIANGDREHDLLKNLELEADLLKWINRHSVQNILDAFDTTDIHEVYSDGHSSKLATSTIKRDLLFLNLHGFYEWGKARQ